MVQNPCLLSQIVEVSGDAIFSEDLNGTITSWNAAAERVYGMTADDMVGPVHQPISFRRRPHCSCSRSTRWRCQASGWTVSTPGTCAPTAATSRSR